MYHVAISVISPIVNAFIIGETISPNFSKVYFEESKNNTYNIDVLIHTNMDIIMVHIINIFANSINKSKYDVAIIVIISTSYYFLYLFLY